MLRNRSLVVAAALLLALTAAACGGDDDDDDGGGSGSGSGEASSDVTKEEFIEEADAICADFSAELEEATADIADDTSPDELATIFQDELLPLFRDQIEGLRSLDLPEADADELTQLFDDLDAATDEIEQQLEDDPQALFSEETPDPYEEADAAAVEYGFEVCGSG